jgi:peptide/nickel transport system permease protein
VVVGKYPHELSGGMAQRVAIAMALSGEPRLLIADEPTTALDVTVQAEILDLLRLLQAERGMSILLVTHDLAVIAALCRRAYVMYAGHIVETGPVRELFDRPLHPYTAGLLDAMPADTPRGGRLAAIRGAVPEPSAWPRGCHFWPRCPLATTDCSAGPIPVVEPASGRRSRCIRAADVPGRRSRASA